RPHLDATIFAFAREMLACLDRLFERIAIDDPETEQLLLGLRKWTVDHQGILASLDEGCRRSGHQLQARPELAALADPVHGPAHAGHHLRILFRGKSAQGSFVVVAKKSIE